MKRSRVVDTLFLLPVVLAFVLVIIIPFFLGIFYSLTDWNGVRSDVTFVGLVNYRSMFQSPEFLYSFLATVAFTVINIVLVNVVAFGLSLLCTSPIKLRNFYRAGFFVPNLIGGIVLGYIWQFIFNNALGQIGATLGLSIFSKSMLSGQYSVIWAMSIVNTWQYAGYIMMIYVAGIQSIPSSLMEAANVDGASYFTRLRKILVPMMASSFTISLFLTLTNSFKQYDMNSTLTNGGPAGLFMRKPVQASQLLAMNIYNTATKNNRYAEGQARAVIFFLVLVVFSLLQVWYNKRKEVEM
ncbi:sugar ABC transporter permease [Eubacteriales bacterium OttesenSCG-928-A19]|nr:sugar ABC transporter permease [Eubacteriales bacterium OttesenSCG-928-A19]